MGHGGDLFLGGNQKLCGLPDPILPEILVGGQLDGAAETPQTFAFADGNTLGDFRNRNFLRVVCMDELQHAFDPLGIPLGFTTDIGAACREIVVLKQDDSGKMIPDI